MASMKHARLIRVEDQTYPLYYTDVRKANSNVSFPAEPTEELLADFGYAVVADGEVPSGEGTVNEIAPKLVDGIWQRQHELVPYTEEELAQQFTSKQESARHRVQQALQSAVEVGFTYQLGKDAIGVQVRDQDRVSLLTLREEARGLATDKETVTFRTASNDVVQVPKQDMIKMSTDALSYHSQLVSVGWALKDAVSAAQSIAELPTIPTTITV